MSNRQLEERAEDEQASAIASSLGIGRDELDELDWQIDDLSSDDGLIYAHLVTFAEGSDPVGLSRIKGLSADRSIQIAPYAD